MKSDEELAKEMQAKEYQALQLRDQPLYPDILYVPKNLPPQHAEFQPSSPPMTDHRPSERIEPVIQEHTIKLLYYAKIMCWVSAIEAITSLVFLMTPIWPLALLAPIAFSGYIAGTKFHRRWSVVFMLFMCFEIIGKFTIILIQGRVLSTTVFGMLFLAVDLYILALSSRFFRLLRGITEVERLELICLRKREASSGSFN